MGPSTSWVPPTEVDESATKLAGTQSTTTPRPRTGAARAAGAPKAAPEARRTQPPPEREQPVRQVGTAALVGLCLGLLLLLLTGVGAYMRSGAPLTPAASTPDNVPPAFTSNPPTPAPTSPPLHFPNNPPPKKTADVTGNGMTIGKVRGQMGNDFIVRSMLNHDTLVHTDSSTKFQVFGAKKITGLGYGSLVYVYGSKHPDQSLTAKVINGIAVRSTK